MWLFGFCLWSYFSHQCWKPRAQSLFSIKHFMKRPAVCQSFSTPHAPHPSPPHSQEVVVLGCGWGEVSWAPGCLVKGRGYYAVPVLFSLLTFLLLLLTFLSGTPQWGVDRWNASGNRHWFNGLSCKQHRGTGQYLMCLFCRSWSLQCAAPDSISTREPQGSLGGDGSLRLW